MPAKAWTGISIHSAPSLGNSSRNTSSPRPSSAATNDARPSSDSQTRPSRVPADTTAWSSQARSWTRGIDALRVQRTFATSWYPSRSDLAPSTCLIIGRSRSGTGASVTMNPCGSSTISGSSMITWRTEMPAWAMIEVTPARMPGFDAFVGTISIAPQFMRGATSRRWQAGCNRSKKFPSSGFFAIVSTVAVTTPRSTLAARASEVKIRLDRDDLPKAWYNILPDLPAPFPPYLHPGTKEPVPPQAFEPLFPKELIRQEMSPNPTEPIPEEIREAYYRFGRPTPLYRATRLEAFLKTPAKIY